jgi:hypothetical protein
MKIDQDYLKKLLEICEAAPAPIFNIEEHQNQTPRIYRNR